MTSDPSQVLNHCCAVLPWCSHNIIIPLGHGISRLLRSLHFLHHLSPMAFDGVNCMRPTPQYSVHNIHALKYHDYYPHCDNYTAISTNYTGNNHTINVTEGQNISISCQIHCPNVDISGFDIVEDWVLIDPQTYKLYYIINSNDADTFTSAFGISMTYSHSNSQPLCPTNGEQPKPFSVTLHNFNASLKELLVICGIRRIQCLSSSHAISLFARLKLDTSPTTGITHHASISLLDPSITSFLMQNLQLHLLLKLAVQLRPQQVTIAMHQSHCSTYQ